VIALHLKQARPDLKIAVIDASEEAVPHTWCLFESDVEGGFGSLPVPLDHHWPGYSVVFPGFERKLKTGYGCLTSSSLRSALREAIGDGLIVANAEMVGLERVTLSDGRILDGRVVLDGRGDRRSLHLDLAWQKFIGLELQLRRPHGLTEPIVMDATVRQIDGFRFLYVLPLAPDRVLVEDTRYSDGPDLDRIGIAAEVLRYARGRGWRPEAVVAREEGVLPIVLGGDIARFWDEPGRDASQVGMRGAFFHPTTGYSFPDALRTARIVAENLDRGPLQLASTLKAASISRWRAGSFYRLLNRMLYQAAVPGERYRILQRFYGLPEPLIERFYAGRSTLADRARILFGRPPVPIGRAMRAAFKLRIRHAAN
jgi:lycopene beta-cyclase